MIFTSSAIAEGTDTVRPVPDVVATVVCAPDDARRYHPKHVERFTEI